MTRKAMYDDLARSGISRRHADALKVKVLTAEQTAKLGHFEFASYRIDYFDIHGKPTGYYRVRYTETVTGEFGRELPREARYSGPTDRPPEAYFPRGVIKWDNPITKGVSAIFTVGQRMKVVPLRNLLKPLPILDCPSCPSLRGGKKGESGV